MVLNLRQAVVGFLKDRAEQKFTARQIAEWLFETLPEECQKKRANSRGSYIKSDADLVQQLVAEISSQRPRMQASRILSFATWRLRLDSWASPQLNTPQMPAFDLRPHRRFDRRTIQLVVQELALPRAREGQRNNFCAEHARC